MDERLVDFEVRLARLEEKVDMLVKEVEELRRQVEKRNGYMKWLLYVYITTLSFLAAALGISWHMGVKP